MAEIQYYDVILKPVITERSMAATMQSVERVKKEMTEAEGKKVLKPVIGKEGKVEKEDVVLRKYTFLVHPDATKTQIKEAVEKMFQGAKVEKVNTMNRQGKKKRRGMIYGRTAKTKKAIVQLTKDSADIEIFASL